MTQETQKLIHVICLTTRFAKIAVSSIARFPARPKERKTMKTMDYLMRTPKGPSKSLEGRTRMLRGLRTIWWTRKA